MNGVGQGADTKMPSTQVPESNGFAVTRAAHNEAGDILIGLFDAGRISTRAEMRIPIHRGDGRGHRLTPLECFAPMPWMTLPGLTVCALDVVNIIV